MVRFCTWTIGSHVYSKVKMVQVCERLTWRRHDGRWHEAPRVIAYQGPDDLLWMRLFEGSERF
jgi:hypothetical protein